MYPRKLIQGGLIEPLPAPEPHGLLLQADVGLGWVHSWLEKIPWIGLALHFWLIQAWVYTAAYEWVAEAVASERRCFRFPFICSRRYLLCMRFLLSRARDETALRSLFTFVSILCEKGLTKCIVGNEELIGRRLGYIEKQKVKDV